MELLRALGLSRGLVLSSRSRLVPPPGRLSGRAWAPYKDCGSPAQPAWPSGWSGWVASPWGTAVTIPTHAHMVLRPRPLLWDSGALSSHRTRRSPSSWAAERLLWDLGDPGARGCLQPPWPVLPCPHSPQAARALPAPPAYPRVPWGKTARAGWLLYQRVGP